MMRIACRVLAPIVAVALLGSCARIGPPLPPSLELPKPVTDLRGVRKGDKVFLTWTAPTRTTVGETVREAGRTRVCRDLQANSKDCASVGQVAAAASAPEGAPAKAEYTDTLPPASAADYTREFTYAVEVINAYGRSAGLSNRIEMPAAPALPPPPGFHLNLTAAGVEIFWDCPPAPVSQPLGVHYQIRVYRREENGTEAIQTAEGDPFSCQRPLIDQSFEWEKTYFYHADVVTMVSRGSQPEIQVEGDDTPEVKIVAHDIFPPAIPSGLQAVFSGVGQERAIDLNWNPDSDADLAGYFIYRREIGGRPAKLNSEPVRASAYRDGAVHPGMKYFYSVSAVDIRGNESQRSEEASETAP